MIKKLLLFSLCFSSLSFSMEGTNKRLTDDLENYTKKDRFYYGCSSNKFKKNHNSIRDNITEENIKKSYLINLINTCNMNELNQNKTPKKDLINNINKMFREEDVRRGEIFPNLRDPETTSEDDKMDIEFLGPDDDGVYDLDGEKVTIIGAPDGCLIREHSKYIESSSLTYGKLVDGNDKHKVSLAVPLPEYWANHEEIKIDSMDITKSQIEKYEPYKIVKVEPYTKEYNRVYESFMAPLNNIEVIEIERIQNPRLYSWYYMKKLAMEKKQFNDGNANEKWLYHATNASYINCIKKEGLDPRLAKMTGSIGVGVYFSRSSATTINYVRKEDAVQKMLYCRVLVGKSVKGREKILRPPYLFGTSEIADSTHGDIGNDKMWSIFDLHQSYPEYIISFINKTSKEIEELH